MTRNNAINETFFFNIHRDILICLLLVLATLAVYGQVRNHAFISFDDPVYVTENSHVQSGLNLEGIKWSFTATHGSNWHPLTWLSHMLDYELYGLRAGMHHLTSLFFHIANSLLLFLVFRRMTGDLWRSGFVAALFALHPLHVESVAWVSERKDVLSTLFWLLTMWFYAFYAERPGFYRYLWVLIFFTLGLMAKPMLVTLPCVLLLIDYWPLGRLQLFRSNKVNNSSSQTSQFSCLIWEKIPLFAFAAFSSGITLFAQQKGGVINTAPLTARIANTLVSYMGYIGKMIWPHHLSVYYPYTETIPLWQTTGAGLLIICISFLFVKAGRNLPYLAVGWLWYLGTLVPVIGLVQVGNQAMADRYTYIPLIGLFILIAWGFPDIAIKRPYKQIGLSVFVSLLLLALMMHSWRQVGHWKNSITIFKHALNVTDNNYLAHNSYGNALKRGGNFKEAAAHYSEALRIKPDYAKARNNLGAVLMRRGGLKEAIKQYAAALRIKPRDAVMLTNLGVALTRFGSIKEAIIHLREALRIKPEFTEARKNLRTALDRQEYLQRDKRYFLETSAIKPDFDAETHKNLGFVLGHQGNIKESIVHFRKALMIKPDYAAAHNYLGVALFHQDQIDEAIVHLREALRIKPDFVEADNNMKKALAELGKIDEAIAKIQGAQRVNPGNAEMYCKLGDLYKRKGQLGEAIGQYEKALSIQPRYIHASNSLATAYTIKGEYDKAISVFKKMIEGRPDNAGAYYNITCLYAKQNKAEASVNWLKKAIDSGYKNWDLIKTDKDLENIRGSSYYKEIMRSH